MVLMLLMLFSSSRGYTWVWLTSSLRSSRRLICWFRPWKLFRLAVSLLAGKNSGRRGNKRVFSRFHCCTSSQVLATQKEGLLYSGPMTLQRVFAPRALSTGTVGPRPTRYLISSRFRSRRLVSPSFCAWHTKSSRLSRFYCTLMNSRRDASLGGAHTWRYSVWQMIWQVLSRKWLPRRVLCRKCDWVDTLSQQASKSKISWALASWRAVLYFWLKRKKGRQSPREAVMRERKCFRSARVVWLMNCSCRLFFTLLRSFTVDTWLRSLESTCQETGSSGRLEQTWVSRWSRVTEERSRVSFTQEQYLLCMPSRKEGWSLRLANMLTGRQGMQTVRRHKGRSSWSKVSIRRHCTRGSLASSSTRLSSNRANSTWLITSNYRLPSRAFMPALGPVDSRESLPKWYFLDPQVVDSIQGIFSSRVSLSRGLLVRKESRASCRDRTGTYREETPVLWVQISSISAGDYSMPMRATQSLMSSRACLSRMT